MKKVAVLTLVVMSLPLAGTLQAQGPRPVGEQFQINSYTTDNQRGSEIALDSLGNFVVVWESLGSSGTDTDRWSIQAQRYDSDGAPVGITRSLAGAFS